MQAPTAKLGAQNSRVSRVILIEPSEMAISFLVCLFVRSFVLDMTVTLHSTAQYTESTALPNYGLAQAWFKTLGTQLTL